eukprot:3390416-Alexandrium_andersonii.AAC.1
MHLWWDCPAHAAIRHKVWGDDVPEHSALPPCLAKAGLSPTFRWGVGPACWEAPEGQHPDARLRWTEPPEAVSALLERYGARGPVTCESIAASIQGSDTLDELPPVDAVVHDAPLTPTIFVDGSVKPPQSPARAVAGIGVFCPHDVDSPNELAGDWLNFCFDQETQAGKGYFACFDSHRPSSTRAEAGAA